MGILVGDFLETAIWVKYLPFDFKTYWEIMLQKSDDGAAPIYIQYIVGLVGAILMVIMTLKDKRKKKQPTA